MRVAILFAVLALVPGAVRAGDNDCTVCHSEVAVKFRGSAHANEGVTCTACHGGDPTTTDVDAAHRGLREAVERAGIPDFCGSCHADPVAMAAYGLPADQLALYRISGHGRALAAGDLSVAVCTDCHGVHNVARAAAPDSPTQARNVAHDCGQCHSGDGPGSDVLSEYEGSVHHAALQGANPRAPSCVHCHGSHGAAPPGVSTVNRVCGQCHLQAREAFRHSPHYEGIAIAGEPQCAACHGNHRVTGATHEMWAACADCHEESSEAVRRGDKILTLLQQTEAELDRAHESTEAARSVPLEVREYQSRLEMAATYLEEARPQTHTLDPSAVEELTRKARSIAHQVQSDVAGELHVLDGRSLVVLFLWLYIVVTVAALQLYRRSLH